MLLDRIGVDTYRSACRNIFEQARMMDREAIERLTDGTYSREGHLDDDGVGDEPVKVALKLTIEGNRMIVDLGRHVRAGRRLRELRSGPNEIAPQARLQDDESIRRGRSQAARSRP